MAGENRRKRLPRLSSTTSLVDFSSTCKRKRKIDEDALSIQSLNTSLTHKKGRRSLLKVSSLANLLSPVRPVKKVGKALQKSLSFKVPPSPARIAQTPYKVPQPSPAKPRFDRSWSEMMTITGCIPGRLSIQDIKRQEVLIQFSNNNRMLWWVIVKHAISSGPTVYIVCQAIYELYQGELDLIQDLIVVKTTYHDSMKKLQLLSDKELQQIFGPIESLIPIHQEIVDRLLRQKLPDGTTQGVGKQLVEWVHQLKLYTEVCANQWPAKVLLDEKMCDPAVDDFLQRCMESPFSRKLDLWSFLDGPRGRFVKYPLLIKSILKYTTSEREEQYLEESIRLIERLIAEADEKTGEAKCKYFRAKFTYLYEEQKSPCINESRTLVCNGILKNNKGTKLNVFLLDKVLVISRQTSHNSQEMYQVYRQPIPLAELVLEDLKDTEIKMGSFRNAFGQGQTAKNVFRVSFQRASQGQAHTLIASNEHDKRQWMQCLNKVILWKPLSGS